MPEDVSRLGKREIAKYVDSKRLAYYDNALVWWCPSCRIVCANEEVLMTAHMKSVVTKLKKEKP
jgi:leucyl-tRNA synthetase